MSLIRIIGGCPLAGCVSVKGAKNGALPILFGSIIAEDVCTFRNVPDIGDLRDCLGILRAMGARVEQSDRHTVTVDPAGITPEGIPLPLTSRLRASSYLLGACLARFGYVPSLLTGGCDFGNRPLDCHFDVFRKMGAVGEGALSAPRGLFGITHTFPRVSVGATVNALLAASRAEGVTRLCGCAVEPHVADFERFLLSLGVGITGIGTPDVTVRGSTHLGGTSYTVAPDDMEAGTYLCAAAAAGGSVTVCGVDPVALAPVTEVLSRIGCGITAGADCVTLTRRGALLSSDIETAPAPGFPTDLHPPMAAVLCLASGESRIRERVWAHRFRYTNELARMGADLSVSGDTLSIRPSRLFGAEVSATDLRGGAALVVAALAAQGESRILDAEVLARGYEDMPGKLRALGARVDQE